MKSVIILLSVLIIAWPSKANACDPNSALFGATLIARDTTSGMAMIAGDFVAIKAARATVIASSTNHTIIN